jgi:acetolactate synthase-1/2/3 large subunit
MTTTGEALISLLETHGVEVVFGIPGVHTIELYRGLARSRIRHVTPRHEQGAGFMADGYARVAGKPGVVLVITGPGLTNTITAMAQARADSVPMLVISGVNAVPTLGRCQGLLHELPDQRAMLRTLALFSHRIENGTELSAVIGHAFALFASARPGPVHIEIPLDVMGQSVELPPPGAERIRPATPDAQRIAEAAGLCTAAERPLILVGGGAKFAERALRRLAEALNAPVVATTNARGLMHRHQLLVPASPSLKAVRALIADADLVIAAGTEFGATDYDMYGDGGFVAPANMVRLDIDAAQLKRWPASVEIQADCGVALNALFNALPSKRGGPDGPARAQVARAASWEEVGPQVRRQVRILEMVRDALPDGLFIGDSTQPVYAGNLYYDHDRPGCWFNAATGYGALGYGPPAAIGAQLAAPDAPVVCLAGDGGFQFTMAELGSAVDAGTPVIFVIWNNRGYREIETAMLAAGVEPVGVSPVPPDFQIVAQSYGLPAERIASLAELPAALRRARALRRPCVVEVGPELIG